jgi:Ketosteroid isomerase homolog
MALDLGARSLPSTPERATLAFAEAQNAGDLDAAASFFARDACFLTPDATVIRGREEIRAVLAQLIASCAQIQVEGQSMLRAGEVALSIQRWTMRSHGVGAPFVQTSSSTVLLRHLERTWKLLIVAPWGLGGAARDSYVAASQKR